MSDEQRASIHATATVYMVPVTMLQRGFSLASVTQAP